MFNHRPCSVEGCRNTAFAGQASCFMHLDGAEELALGLLATDTPEESSRDLCLAGASLSGLDLSRRKFLCCNFSGAILRNCLFTGASFRISIFDGAAFSGCDFSGVDMDFCSFGSCLFEDCSFENAELIHVNFDGARISDCTFTGSNLYDSRFLLGEIERTRFDDCDFKRVYFIPSREEGVTMKNSNTMEAVRDFGELYR